MFLYKPANSRIHALSIKALKKYAQASLMAFWRNRYVTENVNEFNLISRRSDSTFTKSLNIEIKKLAVPPPNEVKGPWERIWSCYNLTCQPEKLAESSGMSAEFKLSQVFLKFFQTPI